MAHLANRERDRVTCDGLGMAKAGQHSHRNATGGGMSFASMGADTDNGSSNPVGTRMTLERLRSAWRVVEPSISTRDATRRPRSLVHTCTRIESKLPTAGGGALPKTF